MASTTKVRLRRYNGTDYDSIYLSANMGDVIDALPIEHGGTGASSSAAGIHGLITAATSLPGAAIEGTDYLPILDASGNVGKKASMGSIMAFIASYCNATINLTSPSGTAVTVSHRGSTISTHTGTGSAVPVEANHTGTWTLTGTLNGVTNSVDVEVTGDGVYSTELVFFVNPLNTDSFTLGDSTVYFKAYPSLKWQVQHVDGDYAYLALAAMTELTQYDSSGGCVYATSTAAAKCITFLNNTIPNVSQYLEYVTVNGVTYKVFLPSYYQFSGKTNYGSDQSGPVFIWPSKLSDNAGRICNYNGSAKNYWLSTASTTGDVGYASVVGNNGTLGGGQTTTTSNGFRPAVKVRFNKTQFTGNPLNTDQLTLGQNDVYFTAYPDLRWCVDHIDGDYAYLGLYDPSEKTVFGSNNTYAGSTIAAKCTTFLNSNIPNVSQYLEPVTVNGVTNKVFIPSYKMFNGTPYGDGADIYDPTFDWTSASATNRAACVSGSGWSAIGNTFLLSSPIRVNKYDNVWRVANNGNFNYNNSPTNSLGFRPEVKVRFKKTPFDNPLNTDHPILGDSTVYFKAYPNIKWQVQHLEGDYVYLALSEMTEVTNFSSTTSDTAYIFSVIATKCTNFLNNTIPNVANYLEDIAVERVVNKVFIPTYYQISGNTGYGDQYGPVFDWPSASASNRKCNYNGSAKAYWLTAPYESITVWSVNVVGGFSTYTPPTSLGFRPYVKVRYKE